MRLLAHRARESIAQFQEPGLPQHAEYAEGGVVIHDDVRVLAADVVAEPGMSRPGPSTEARELLGHAERLAR